FSACKDCVGSAPDDLDWERTVAPDKETGLPARRQFGIEGDTARAIEEHGEHVAGLDSGQGSAHAVVDPPSEGHVTPGDPPREIDLVGPLELGGVAVGCAPKQQHGRVGGDRDAVEGGVFWYEPHEIAEGGLDA